MTETHSVWLNNSSLQIRPEQINQALDTYFEKFHRHPLWCFERQDVEDLTQLPGYFVLALFELTSRFIPDFEHRLRRPDAVRTKLMLKIADGNVDLPTLQSLCLFSYSLFLGM